MRILAIGDVTSTTAADYLASVLWDYRKREKIDLVIANAENAGFITGTSAETARKLLLGGVDCLTGGNHTMRNRSVHTYLDEESAILRPINFGGEVPGHGYTVLDVLGWRVLVISALGCVHMDPTLNSPFSYIDRVLLEEKGRYDFSVLDIHAEATGEKYAIGYEYDGRINVVFGTHTHVQTADEQILPLGTGYMTDIGMCGESEGILGIERESVIASVKTHMPPKFKVASGPVIALGAVFTLDTKSGRVTDIKRVKI